MINFVGTCRYILLGIYFLLFNAASIISQPQTNPFQGKKIGLYISSVDVNYTEYYYFPISQFLSVGENRLGAEKMKTEFLIRLGEMFTNQIEEISLADTVYFVNANIERGKSIRNAYDKDKKMLVKPSFFDMDFIMVIDQLNLSTYKARSVFIQSNRMYSEQIDYKIADLQITLFQEPTTVAKQTFQTCVDDKEPFNEEYYFDFHNKNSSMGKFLGKLFSLWWVQLKSNNSSSCDEQ